MKSNFQIIIPMSGEGKRFKDFGYKELKPFIKIHKNYMINHVINMLEGFNDYLFICNDSHLKNNCKKKIKSQVPQAKIVSIKKNKLGPVMALKKFENLIQDDKEIIISYCDFFSMFNTSKLLSFIKKHNSHGLIVTYTGFHPHMLGKDHYAYLSVNKKFQLNKIYEKKALKKDKLKEIVSNGLYYFKSGRLLKKVINELIKHGPKINNEYYVSLLFNFIVQKNLRVNYYMVNNMCQWGTPHDLENFKKWNLYFKIENKIKKKIKFNNTTLLMPMAGSGSRFSKEGYKLPKPLLDINGKYMFEKAVKDLPIFDDYKFIILEEHNKKFKIKNLIKNKFKNSDILQLKKKTDGQARSCMMGVSHFKIDENKKLFISACDNGAIYSNEYLSNLISDDNIDIIVWTFRNNESTKKNPYMYSWVNVDNNNFVKNVSVKKLNGLDPSNSHTFLGSVLFKKTKFFTDGFKENIKRKIKHNNEYYVDEIINRNIEMSLKVKIFEVNNYICWGTPNDYKTYIYWNKFFKNNKTIF